MEYLILYKKLFYRLTPEEEEIFDHWYAAASPEERAYFQSAQKDIQNPECTLMDKEALWERFILKIKK